MTPSGPLAASLADWGGTVRARIVSSFIVGSLLTAGLIPFGPAIAAPGAWDTPVPISPGAVDASSPTIAHDGQRIIAAWISGSGSNEVVLVSNSDDGLGWTTPIAISTPGELSAAVQLVARNGVMTAGWTRIEAGDRRVQVATSTNGGGAWSAPVTLSDFGASADELFLATDGPTTFAAWLRSDGSFDRVQIAVSDDSGASWSSAETVSPSGIRALTPHLVVRGATTTASWTVTGSGTFTVQSASSVDGGATWTAPVSVPGFGLNQQFVDDGVFVTAVYQVFSGPIHSSYSTDGGATWSTPVMVSEAFFGQAELASVALTLGQGTATVNAAWIVFDGSHSRVQTAFSTDGGATWSTPVYLSAAGQNAAAAELATDGETITAVWQRFDGGFQRVQVSTSGDGGVTWTEPTTLSGDGQGALGPKVTSFDRTTTVIWRRSDGANDRVEVSSFTIPITVSRLAGTDRYRTAVEISKEFEAGVPIVYLATGTDYPDALSAASAAAAQGGPLLLTTPASLPSVVATELQRLDPELVVIVGGLSVVSATVQQQVEAALPSAVVRRDSGANRYATSRMIADRAFDSAGFAFIATGVNFPDALSASAAAGASFSPVILVNGRSSSIDAATLQLLDDLGVTRVAIAGGTSVVSTGIENDLKDVLGSFDVLRLSGADRFATSVAINRGSFEGADSVFLATGLGFADALAGAALAGRELGPLYVVPRTCVPPAVLLDIDQFRARSVVLFGGTSVLTVAVESLTPC